MTSIELISAIRAAQEAGLTSMTVTLSSPVRGCKRALLTISGAPNGNRHDVWVESLSRKKTLGRIYLGSRKMPANTEGWEAVIADLS
jgi:hypothetical protein